MHWQATGEALVAGKVTSLAVAVTGNYLFAGTDAGCVYASLQPIASHRCARASLLA